MPLIVTIVSLVSLIAFACALKTHLEKEQSEPMSAARTIAVDFLENFATLTREQIESYAIRADVQESIRAFYASETPADMQRAQDNIIRIIPELAV